MEPVNRKRLQERIGNMNQAAGMKQYVLQEGRMRNVAAADVWNGAGLEYTIICDRASDIYSMRFKGDSLCWLSNLGIASPFNKHRGDFEWDRNFSGGMMVTCGLNTAGLPSHDGGEFLELHGAISNTPSEEISLTRHWDGNHYYLDYRSKTYQAVPYGEYLCLSRLIRTEMGINRVQVFDEIENLSTSPAPIMILYHLNFGYPLLDTETELYLDYEECYPTSAWAEEAVAELGTVFPPDDSYKPKAYNFTLKSDGEGFCHAAVINRKKELGVSIRFNSKELNRFNIWKCLQKQKYVIGMEPCNCRTWGREKERETNGLRYLAPEDHAKMEFELIIHQGQKEIEKATERFEGKL